MVRRCLGNPVRREPRSSMSNESLDAQTRRHTWRHDSAFEARFFIQNFLIPLPLRTAIHRQRVAAT